MLHSSNKKEQQILEKGQELFWKYGFKRVTIEEICAEAAVSKMTFYKYFDNKMALVQEIMERVISHAKQQFLEVMSRDIPFSEKVELQIQMKLEGTIDISKEFMDDVLVHGDRELTDMWRKLAAETTQIVFESYVQAQKEGHVRQDLNPQFIMYFMNHMFDMLKDEKLMQMYDSTSDLATELIKFFFYGILEECDKPKR